FTILFLLTRCPPRSTLFPYTTLFRSGLGKKGAWFSGYGDNLDRSLRSGELPESSEPSTLSFDTWYRVEAEPGTGDDSGTVEASEIGRAHVELQSRENLVCRLLLEKKK